MRDGRLRRDRRLRQAKLTALLGSTSRSRVEEDGAEASRTRRKRSGGSTARVAAREGLTGWQSWLPPVAVAARGHRRAERGVFPTRPWWSSMAATPRCSKAPRRSSRRSPRTWTVTRLARAFRRSRRKGLTPTLAPLLA